MSKTISRYTIELIQDESDEVTVHRTAQDFDAHLLLAHLEYAKFEILQQLQGHFEDNQSIKRNIVITPTLSEEDTQKTTQ